MKTQWQAGDRVECNMNFVANAVQDAPEGYIAGIASTPSTDLYGHKVLAKAFDDSIKRKGLSGPRGVKLLVGHDWHKPGGIIKRLETYGENLHIEAQLNLNVSYVKDVHEVAKQNGGLNFSVGFSLEEFEFVEDEDMEKDDDPWLIIKKGDLMEVSVVVFPAQLEAEMTFIKVAPPNTLAELEKALAADGTCRSRSEAQRMIRAIRPHAHLLQGKPAPSVQLAGEHGRPVLDASILRPMAELIAKAKATLSSR